MTWNEESIAKLQALLAQELTYTAIAKELRTTKEAVAGAVYRHIHKVPDTRKRHKRVTIRAEKTFAPPWTERSLTETWEERKARKKREAAKPPK